MKSAIIIILVVVTAACFAGAFALYRANGSQQVQSLPVIKPAVVRVATLQQQAYTPTVVYSGAIQPIKSVEMSFQVAGKIQQLGPTRDSKLRANTPVRKDEVIAMIEPDLYQAELKTAESEAEEIKAGIAVAQSVVGQKEAAVDRVNAELTRVKGDLEANLEAARQGSPIGAKDLRELEASVRKAKADYESAVRDRDGAIAAQKSAEARYNSARERQNAANTRLQYCVLKAPFDSIVAYVPYENGKQVQPGENVMTLININKAKLMLEVVEKDVHQLEQGQKVFVEVRALNNPTAINSSSQAQPREGLVTLVPPAADPRTGLFIVEVELDNTDGALKPGMFGRATVVGRERQVVAVPVDAVDRAGNQLSAFFIKEGATVGLDLGPIGKSLARVPTATAHRVILNPEKLEKDHYLLPLSPEGETRIVVEGQSRLVDGQPVIIVD